MRHTKLDFLLDNVTQAVPDVCILWPFANGNGYGRVKVDKLRLVHVVAYEAINGPVPNNLELDHLCQQTLCYNYIHLEAVSHQVNRSRGVTVYDVRWGESCCNGHAYSDANTYINNAGSRVCRRCRVIAQQKYRQTLI